MTAVETELVADGKYPVGSEAWAARVRRRAQKLNTVLEVGYMELASILYLIYDTPIDGNPQNAPVFRMWGFDSWEDWVDSELHLKPDKARYLRRIHYVLNIELAGMDERTRQRVSKLGLSKVGKLLRVLTVSNADRWCDLAETLSTKELDNAVKDSLKEAEKKFQEQALSGDDENAVEPEPVRPRDVKSKHFGLFPEQMTIVNEALARSKELSASKKPSHNLTLICMDFLANNDFRLSNDAEMKLRYVAKLESILGKKLVMVDPETREVEYGVDALKLLVENAGVQE